MGKPNGVDENRVEGFNNIIDATSAFLKAIFPSTIKLIRKLRPNKKPLSENDKDRSIK